MTVCFVTGTDTGVGKTVVTAALAVILRARRNNVAVVKPAQTGVRPGEPGDVDEVRRLAGPSMPAKGSVSPTPWPLSAPRSSPVSSSPAWATSATWCSR